MKRTVLFGCALLLSGLLNAGGAVLIATNATWKYLDNGVDQGNAWRATAFDDSAWAAGPAELGAGDGDEATVTQIGQITTYFRRAFNVVNPASYGPLTFRLNRDDGAVVYLNGTEIYRNNMPTGAISYATLASSTTEGGVFFTNTAANTLNAGLNVVAVEVHQANTNSTDISFALELSATSVPMAMRITHFTTNDGSHLAVDGTPGGTFTLQSSTNGSLWSNLVGGTIPASGTFLYTNAFAGIGRLYRTADGGGGGEVYSVNVVGVFQQTIAPGYAMIANHLRHTNSLVTTVLPSAPAGVSIYKIGSDNRWAVNNFYQGWNDAGMTLRPGDGVFLRNSTVAPLNIAFIGELVQGTLVNQLPAGFSMCSSVAPQSGLVGTALQYPAADEDILYFYNPATSGYNVYQFFVGEWFPNEPVAGVGESFWALKTAAGNWTRVFGEGGGNYNVAQNPASSSEGQINFFTYNTNASKGRVLLPTSTPVGSSFYGQLYAGTVASEGSLAPIGARAQFLGTSGYIRSGGLVVPSAAPNDSRFFQLRVWDIAAGTNYEAAVANNGFRGKSEVFGRIVGGGLQLPPDANDFASFTVAIAPVLTGHPESQTVTAGSTVTFQASANGSGPLTFRWRRDLIVQTNVVVFTSNSVYSIPNVQTNHAGNYTVVVTNFAGSVTSSISVLTVLPDSDGDGLPNSWEVTYGLNPNSAADAGSDPDGDGMTNLEEYRAGTHPLNASSRLAITSIARSGGQTTVTFASIAGVSYAVESAPTADGPWSVLAQVTGAGGSTQVVDPSAAASRYYRVGTRHPSYPPVYSVNKVGYVNQLIANGFNDLNRPALNAVPDNSLAVMLPAPPDDTCIYVWNPGAGTYNVSCFLGGWEGEVSQIPPNTAFKLYNPAAPFTLTFIGEVAPSSPPVITMQPQSRAVPAGTNVQFTVTANGTPPLSYQWRKGGVDIPGATAITLTLNSVSAADAGNYSVQVANAVGLTNSASAALTVTFPHILPGQTLLGNLVRPGAFNFYAFAGSAGQTATIILSEGVDGGFTPTVELRAPGGVTIIATNWGIDVAQVHATLPETGDYLIVCKDRSGLETNFYAVSLVLNPSAAENGAIAPGQTRLGDLSFGDVDTFSFAGNAGETATAILSERTDGGFTPYIELHAPNGLVLATNWSADAAQIYAALPQSGTYLLLCRDFSGAHTNGYALSLVKNPGPNTNEADGGLIITGQTKNGVMSFGDVDVFHFTGTAGERATINFTKQVPNGFFPYVELHAPNGSVIATNLNTPTASIQSALLNQSGTHLIVVRDFNGGDTNLYTLSLTLAPAPPMITTQPQSQTVVAGSNVTFSVTASGTAPLSYQWLIAATPIASATSSSLTLTNVQAAQAGSYRVVVSNPSGSVTSTVANLTVLVAPTTVTLQPSADTTLLELATNNNMGGATALKAGLTHNLTKNRALIAFNVASQIPSNAVVLRADLHVDVNRIPVGTPPPAPFSLYRVLRPWGEGIGIGDNGALARTNEATWNARFAFTAQPWGAPGAAPGVDYFPTRSASAVIQGFGPYVFASTNQLVADVQAWIASPQTNFGWILIGDAESTPGTARRFSSREDAFDPPELVVQYGFLPTAPSIVTQPQSLTVVTGSNATFNVVASGTPPLNYQWFFNGTAITTATNVALNLNNVQSANAGSYHVVVGNASGSVTSTVATLTLTQRGLIAAESFEYADGVIAGLNGGVGFRNAHTGGGSVSSASLAYTDTNGAALPTSGGRYLTLPNPYQPVFRDLDTNGQPGAKFGVPGSIVYVGFLVRLDSGTNAPGTGWGGVSLFDGATERVFFGDPGFPGQLNWGVDRQLGSNNVRLSSVPVDFQTHLLVGRIDFGVEEATVRLYVDPPLNREPSVASVAPFATPPFRFTTLRIASSPNGYSFDEIKIGSSYDDVVQAVPSCVNPPSGLVAWWTMEGQVRDVVGANQPSATNALSFPGGKVGAGLSPQAGAYVEIPHSQSLDNQRFTFAAWVRPDGIGPNDDSSGSVILNKIRDGSFGYSLTWNSTGRFRFFTGSSASTLTSASTFPAGSFYLVAGTYDGLKFRLYVNGVVQAERASTNSIDYSGSNPWAIGANPTVFHPTFRRTWNGVIDEVTIFGRALSSNEIAAVYAAGHAGMCPPSSCVTPPSALVAWWRGEGNALDSMGGNHGTLTNGTTFASGRVGQAFEFDGENDFVKVPDAPSLRFATGFTVAAWVRLDAYAPTNRNSPIIHKDTQVSGDRSYYFAIGGEGDGRVDLAVFGTGHDVSAAARRSDVSLALGQWHHVAGVYSGGPSPYLDVYVDGRLHNGSLLLNSDVIPANIQGNNHDVFLGAYVNGIHPFPVSLDGLIDEVAVFRSALSSNEIAAIYAAGVSGMCPPQRPPTIVSAPPALTLSTEQDAAALNVAVMGTSPFYYQWFLNGAAISGATSSTLNFASINFTNRGHYSVVISNAFGSVTSSVATVLVRARPWVYWSTVSGGGTPIKRAWLDGSHTETVLSGPAGGRFGGIAFDPLQGRLYTGDGAQFLRANLNGSGRTNLYSMTFPVGDVEFDQLSRQVFWTHFSAGSALYRGSADASTFDSAVQIIDTTTGGWEGIAVDSAAARVYWANTATDINDSIEVANFDGSSRQSFIATPGANPFDVEIDSEQRRAVWYEFQPSPRIRATALDGAGAPVTVVSGAPLPGNGIHVDSRAQKLYFSGAGGSNLHRINLDGTGLETLLSDPLRINYIEVLYPSETNRLDVFAQGGGTTFVTPKRPFYDFGDQVTISASANRYHQFLGWSDGNTSSERTITIGLSNTYTAIFTNTALLQTVSVKLWDRSFGGASDDYNPVMKRTSDGGMIVLAQTTSGVSGNKTTGLCDPEAWAGWVIKLDADGNKQWEQTVGTYGNAFLYDIVQTSEGGYVLAGYVEGAAGGITNSCGRSGSALGDYDLWVVKLNTNGQRLWDRSFGGVARDGAFGMVATSDGGFLLVGNSDSPTGPGKSAANRGGADGWAVRIASNGTKLWDRSFGGTSADSFAAATLLPDGGFLMAGSSSSAPGGNKSSPAYGDNDFWVVRIDASGNKLWDRSYGGNAYDAVQGLALMPDGGAVLSGFSSSSTSGSRTSPAFTPDDYWVVRIDSQGNQLWDRAFGGAGDADWGYRVLPAGDGGVTVCGFANSGVSGNKQTPLFGLSDGWALRLDSSGNKIGEFAAGGTRGNSFTDLANGSGGEMFFVGDSDSGPGGNKTSPHWGGLDVWLVKAVTRTAPIGTPVVLVDGRLYPDNAATVTNSATVEIRNGFPGGSIFYTLDGSDPDYGEFYLGPFPVANDATIRAVAYSANFLNSAEADPIIVTVLRAPVIVTHPQNQRVAEGSPVQFSVVATGEPPLRYQWYKGLLSLSGQTNATLTVAETYIGESGEYHVVVSNDHGSVASDPAQLSVLRPPRITAQPMNVSAPPGTTNVMLCVNANGDLPLLYQWRKNGVNLAGETNECLVIPILRVEDGGTYEAVVENPIETIVSSNAVITVVLPILAAGDLFAQRVFLPNAAGMISANNRNAGKEPGEPNHGGKPGGRSVWYRWVSPGRGIATFRTSGSTFDTLLGAYTGTHVAALTTIAGNEDDGGFLTSLVRFNTEPGQEFAIGVDGFGNTEGDFNLLWDFVATLDPAPVIFQQPQSFTVLRGTNVSLVAGVSNAVRLQWLFNGVGLPGQESPRLDIPNVQPANVGDYRLAATNAAGIGIFSDLALVEIGSAAAIRSADKLEDFVAPPLPLGTLRSKGVQASAIPQVNAGGLDAQIINNSQSTASVRENNVCHAIGDGRSRWFQVIAGATATLRVDTIGSEVDTLLSVFIGTQPIEFVILPGSCDDNSAPDGLRSVVKIPATNGVAYSIQVDTKRGTNGVIQLNWGLGFQPTNNQVPVNRSFRQGDTVTLVCNGDGTPRPHFHWSVDGRFVHTSTNGDGTLVLPNIQPSSAGRYSVIISNFIGAITNFIAEVRVETNAFVAAQNGFDTGVENWAVRGGATSVGHGPAGGNPGGYLIARHSDAATDWYWVAPPAYLGNKYYCYGGVLSFDLRQNTTGLVDVPAEDVILEGAGLRLVFDRSGLPGSNWTSHKILLSELGGWRFGGLALSNPPATREHFIAVLTSLTNMMIRGQTRANSDIGDLDNVLLVAPPTPSLSLRREGAQWLVEWPQVLEGFSAQTTEALGSGLWLNLVGPVQTNNLNSIRVPAEPTQRFFRLIKP